MASACYVYAIVRRGDTTHLPHNLTGLKGEPLTIVPWQALAAVISTTEESRIQPRAILLMRHEVVVEVICQIMPALPVRFGTVLPNATAVAHALEERYELLLSDLARIGGKQEIGVTVILDSMEDYVEESHVDAAYKNVAGRSYFSAEEQGQGTRYLMARKEAYQRQQATLDKAQTVVTDLDAILRPCAYQSRYTIHAKPRIIVRATYLLAPEMSVKAHDALALFQDQHSTLRLLVTGPWPPYSFVGFVGEREPVVEERSIIYDGFPPET